jgi:hypothetical protein
MDKRIKLLDFGSWMRRLRRIANMIKDAMIKRSAAEVMGGAPSKPTLIMSQVELQIKHRII